MDAALWETDMRTRPGTAQRRHSRSLLVFFRVARLIAPAGGARCRCAVERHAAHAQSRSGTPSVRRLAHTVLACGDLRSRDPPPRLACAASRIPAARRALVSPRARHALRTRARAPQAQWRRRAALLIGCGCFPHPHADAPRPLGSRMRMSHLLCTSARADLALPHFPPAVCVLRGRPFWDHGIAGLTGPVQQARRDVAPTCRAPALLLALLALLPAGQCLLPLPQRAAHIPTVGAAYIAAKVRLTSRSQLGYLLSSLGPSGWTSRNFLVPNLRPQPHAARLLCCALGLGAHASFADFASCELC